MLRTTYARVSLRAIRHNVEMMRACLSPDTQFLAVVKADAYGHGAVPVARACLEAGAARLAVAIPEEGIELREAGIAAPIHILGTTEDQAAEEIVRHDLIPVVYEPCHVDSLSRAARRLEKTVRVHLAADTGMGRIGVCTPEAAVDMAEYAQRAQGVELEGIMTHMATADEEESTGTLLQMDRFEDICLAVSSRMNGRKLLIHGANTASIFRYPRLHHDIVRGGIALYGYPPCPGIDGLMPALTWVTRAATVRNLPEGSRISYGGTCRLDRDSRVMTLPVGYADGYNRLLSDRGWVLVCGRRAPVLGRVCMDQIMVDVTDIPEAAAGAEVVLLGCQGNESFSADDMAFLTGTISYEILCNISKRVPRVYEGCPEMEGTHRE